MKLFCQLWFPKNELNFEGGHYFNIKNSSNGYQWLQINIDFFFFKCTFTTIPVGMCLSTTQLLVLLVACPPGPDPLTNCSSSSSSFRTGRSIRSFLPAAKTSVSPAGSGFSSGQILGDPLQRTRLNTLFIQLMIEKTPDISPSRLPNYKVLNELKALHCDSLNVIKHQKEISVFSPTTAFYGLIIAFYFVTVSRSWLCALLYVQSRLLLRFRYQLSNQQSLYFSSWPERKTTGLCWSTVAIVCQKC